MALSRTGIASLALLAAALVFAFMLGFILACGSSEPDSFDERWAELGLEEAEFVFADDFALAEQESVRAGLRVAQVVFAESFGAVTSNFTVYLLSTDLYEEYEERVAPILGGAHDAELTCGVVDPEGALIVAPRSVRKPSRMGHSWRTSTSLSSNATPEASPGGAR